ncbi:putative F-box protein At3g25750 [Vicia villosa]|uniref:putative F-box protein At3g25750 n=1 Tax=Vicia villosa TaxID=3911 RepID=UPI00273CAC64|nr:putative F-box protein At3g25750 [Vicia villosa]
MEPDWANLEALALGLILDKLEWVDHIWFGAVCKNWLSVVKLNHQNQQLRTSILPMLMIPKANLCLYGISTKTTYEFQLPIPYYDNCCGCSHGWIATFDRKYHAYFAMDIVITMVNSFKSVSPITLPPLTTCSERHYEVQQLPKVTLSADPITSPNDYVVAVIYSKCNRLSILKAGQTSWTSIGKFNFNLYFMDVIFYGDMVYGLTNQKGVLSFNLSYLDDPDSAKAISPIPGIRFHKDLKCYLVKSLEGDLWLVRKFLDDCNHNGMIKFEVYMLEFDVRGKKIKQLVKLESLGDNVIFVGDCDSISASASYFSGCLKQDSIYYINKVKHYTPFHEYCEPYNVEIYNVKDGSICHQDPEYSFVKHMPPPFWILLPLQ